MDWSVITAIVIAIAVIPIIITGTTSLLDMFIKNHFSAEWDNKATAIVGGVGIITHELGHAVAAVLFRHHVRHIKFLQVRNLSLTQTFGSVDDTWDPTSFYQRLGNFFIGIAPFFSCSGLLYVTHYMLIGTHHQYLGQPMNTSGIAPAVSVLESASQNVSNNLADDIQHPLMAMLFTILVVIVSLAGYSMSEEDWRCVCKGAVNYIAFAVMLAAVWLCLGSYWPQVSAYAWKLASCLAFLMLDSWLYLLATFCITEAIRMIVKPSTQSNFSIVNTIKNILAPRGKHFSGKD